MHKASNQVIESKKLVNGLVPIYENKITEAKNLIAELEEMGLVGSWWDSKVPEEDKVGWDRFWEIPFKNVNWSEVSDKDEVIMEIKVYLSTYEQMAKIAKRIGEVVEREGSIIAAGPEIRSLKKSLSEAIERAKESKDVVKSTKVYRAHLSLISTQRDTLTEITMIDGDIERCQTIGLERKHKDIQDKCEALEQGNKTTKQEIETLKQENRKTKQQVQELIQGFRDIMQGNTPPSTSLDSVLGVDSRSNQNQL